MLKGALAEGRKGGRVEGEMKIKSEFGFCTCCQSNTKFSSTEQWLRDFYVCESCGCSPRERALMKVISECIPDFEKKIIHESSPAARGASLRLKNQCEGYISSHYWADETYSEDPHININLEKQNIASERFDLVVMQDVFEHLPNPKAAIKEIYRTLKPGGYCIQTVPFVNGFRKTQKWASLANNGVIQWEFEPDYHLNPIDPKGSPVFWHYGYDLASKIDKWTEFQTIIVLNQSRDLGIEGELCEVTVSYKQV
ncbi:class I SAM-dependent methyltransferase [Alphaproteobacteria bacterium]|nr:class I SAM-dependent methyltransferase [Alphaproteobacteria bacterium]